jgi:phenylalanyl-tRNA synthetase beta chain
MKISYNWLKDLIALDATAEEVSSMLTGCGLEVEHLEHYQSLKGGLEGIVVGFVKEREKHPNADKLSVCKVDIGTGEDKQIVCGAPNVAAGQKVLVATVGATLYPSKGEPFKISKSKIRGEVSEGMICAEDEIGLGESHDGILILPDTYEIGKPASEYFPVYTDAVFEIGLTANRGDAASHLGAARDLKAISENRNSKCEIRNSNIELPTATINHPMNIKIEDAEGCKRYTGLSISGIEVKASPDWLQNRLKAIGLNPINNIVDATNYVLHELGQPLHAFDADKIVGNTIVVKKATEGAKFTTLDKVERSLKGHECLICDAQHPLALAGVFGGLDSGISANTKNIFLESAYFDSVSIRKTAKAHGLSTDASFRFERGTDQNMTIRAIKRVAAIILEIAGGEITSEIKDVYPTPIAHTKLEFSLSKSNELIGKEIPKDQVLNILKALEIEVLETKGDLLTLSVPPYRVDVTRPADVTEEILRIYGLNNIEIGNDIKSTMAFSETETKVKLKNALANYLSANGFNEIATNTLTKSSYYSEAELEQAIKILNPLSSDLDVMRMNMLPSMLEAIQYNRNRRNLDLKFYEFGKTYTKFNSDNGQQTKGSIANEQSHLMIALCGRKEPEGWNTKGDDVNYFTLKASIEMLLHKAKISKYDLAFNEHASLDYASSYVVKNKALVTFGSVKSQILKPFDIDTELWFADIDFDYLLELSKQEKFKLQPVSVFPAVRRDLALLIDDSIKYQQLEKIALKTDNKLIKKVNVFDVYKGDKIEQGKKSYALSFILQDESKTLTDEVIDAVMQKLIKNYEKEVGAVLRG